MGATGAMMALSAAQTYGQVTAEKSQAAYQQSMYSADARMNDLRATDAMRRGDVQAAAVARATNRVVGAQKASYAAQGIDVGVGSPVDIGLSTESMAALDALTAKNNAWREAWGYNVQAQNDRMSAGYTRMGARYAVRNTLITGGLNAVNAGFQGWWRGRQANSPNPAGGSGLRAPAPPPDSLWADS